MRAASSQRQQPTNSGWMPPAAPLRRLHLASIRRTRDDPFEREAEANADVARTRPAAAFHVAGARTHADDESASAAHAIGAHAFTIGDDIYFGRGEYQPSTASGRALLAHEMTHVAQQRAGEATPALQGSWWEGAGAIIGGVIGTVVGAAVGGVAGAIGLGIFGALAGGFIGMGLHALFGKDDDVDRTEPKDEGLAENDPKFRDAFQKNLKKAMDTFASDHCAFPFNREWKYDDRYWEKANDPRYRAFKPKGVSPAKAMDELVSNVDLWEFDCALYPEVVLLYAYRLTLGAANFNAKFPDLVIRQHEVKGINEEFFDVRTTPAEKFNKEWDDAPPGSKAMWTNKSTVTEKTAWHNENAIKRTKGDTPEDARYDAHPLGSNLSEKEVKDGLAGNASDCPPAGPGRDTYVAMNIFRSQLHVLKV